MKLITNWKKATVADIEADSLLDEATKIHVLSYHLTNDSVGRLKGSEEERLRKFFKHHIDNKIPIVMHNGIGYDMPLSEKILGIDLSELMVIDTLSLSWYLNTDRLQHGLDSFHEDYGIEKPKIDDWENLSYEEYAHRCDEDVKINIALWEDFKSRLVDIYRRVKESVDSGLVGGKRIDSNEEIYIDRYKGVSSVDEYVDRILTFLMFKADCARLKEKTKWKVDVDSLEKLIDGLSEHVESSKKELEGVMPKVPQYSKKTRPKKPYKKDGSLSASGKAWEEDLDKVGCYDDLGNPLAERLDVDTLKLLKGYEEPNVNGHQQIKDFLFSKGWKPRSFKFVKDEEAQAAWAASGFKSALKPKPRAIPQISVDGDDGKELCESVIELAETVPEIMSYAKYTTVKHRLDMCKGFRENLREGGYLCARVGGYTNTLREKHRELVNLPGAGKPYGKEIRGVLVAEEGKVLLGSDLSSLEDRVKHHFMIPHDPKYVETMLEDDFDPHILMALMSGMITQEEFDLFKQGTKSEKVISARKAGKTVNYAAVYGSGAETLSRNSGLSLALSKDLVEGYWKLNWSVKAIAEEQCVITDDSGKLWLVNPINGFAYSLRTQKDRFSTLCQGTGSFLFDMWIDLILEKMYEKWKVKVLNGQFHDEYITCFRDFPQNREAMKVITEEAISEISERYLLRRKLGCDVQFGVNYSQIH